MPDSFARRRPLTTFLALVFGIGWPMLVLLLLAGVPADPFLLGLVFLGLLAPALLVSRLLGVPVLTVALAAASGSTPRWRRPSARR